MPGQELLIFCAPSVVDAAVTGDVGAIADKAAGNT